MSKLFSFVLLVSMLLSVAHAAGGFLNNCDASTFQFNTDIQVGPAPEFVITVTPTLSGLCPDSSGRMTNSTLNLNTCLANNNAHLLWQRNGMFQTTCDCSLALPNLCCSCGLSNGGTVVSGVCIDLNQGVAASNGQLNCDVLPSNG